MPPAFPADAASRIARFSTDRPIVRTCRAQPLVDDLLGFPIAHWRPLGIQSSEIPAKLLQGFLTLLADGPMLLMLTDSSSDTVCPGKLSTVSFCSGETFFTRCSINTL